MAVMSERKKRENRFIKTKRLSVIFAIALADFRQAERSKGVRVDMAAWLARYGKKCTICLAGACMLKTLTRPLYPHYNPIIYPSDYDGEVAMRLYAINSLRSGDVNSALEDMKRLDEMNHPRLDSRAYKATGQRNKKWWQDMRDILAYLRKHKL